MKVMVTATLAFACHSAVCRPPTSGGTGGSRVKPGPYAGARVTRHGAVLKDGQQIGTVSRKHGDTFYDAEVRPGVKIHGKVQLSSRALERAVKRLDEARGSAPAALRPRHEMPQIPKTHQEAFDRFLAGQGVVSREVMMDPKRLKPTQSEFNQQKVTKMIESGVHKSGTINVSRDGKILDGHHRWKAAVEDKVRKIKTRVYSEPMSVLLKLADRFATEQGIPSRTVEQLGLIAACYSAECRPPTSGGTGGSMPKSGRTLSPVSPGWSGARLRRERLPMGKGGPAATYNSYSSPHYVRGRKSEDVMPMSESEARALVMAKDATGRRVLAKNRTIEDGQPVGVRANLNLKKSTGVTIQTIHEGTDAQLAKGTGMYSGEAIGYQAAVTLRNVNFSVNQEARAAIAEGRQNKFPMASVDGHYVAGDRSDKFDGIEVRFNPMTNHTFVDPDGRAVKSASIATVVGNRVFVRGNITYYTEADMPANKSTVPSTAHP